MARSMAGPTRADGAHLHSADAPRSRHAALARMAGDEAPPAGEAAAAKGVTPPPTPAEAAARARAFFALLWRRYLAALSARPLRTKARA